MRVCKCDRLVMCLSDANRVQRIQRSAHVHAYACHFRRMKTSRVLVYVVTSKTREHMYSHICRERTYAYTSWKLCFEKSKITFLILHDRYVKSENHMRGTRLGGITSEFEYRQNRDGDFLIKIAVADKCKGVRRWEDGLRHRSIGTLVTSAEPRAERIVGLLAFIRYCSERKKHK